MRCFLVTEYFKKTLKTPKNCFPELALFIKIFPKLPLESKSNLLGSSLLIKVFLAVKEKLKITVSWRLLYFAYLFVEGYYAKLWVEKGLVMGYVYWVFRG